MFNERVIELKYLSLRFYKKNGWDFDSVCECFLKGRPLFKEGLNAEGSYWTKDEAAILNIEKIATHKVYDFEGCLVEGDILFKHIDAMHN